MLNRLKRDLDEITIYYETEEQFTNSEEHSELAGLLTTPTITLKDKIFDDDVSVIEAERSETTSAAMMVFNNGYIVMMDTTSSMMNNTLQVTIQPSTAKHLIYYYFSSTLEVCLTIISV